MYDAETIGDCRTKKEKEIWISSELKGMQQLLIRIWIITSKLNSSDLWRNTLSHSLRFSTKKNPKLFINWN